MALLRHPTEDDLDDLRRSLDASSSLTYVDSPARTQCNE
jgi:hypothetical protein